MYSKIHSSCPLSEKNIVDPIFLYYLISAILNQFGFTEKVIQTIFMLIITIVGFIGIATIGILILAIFVTFLAIQYPPLFFDSISKIGIYHKLIRKGDTNYEKCQFGETRSEKVLIVFWHNFWIALPLFLTLLFLFNTFTSSPIPSMSIELNNSLNLTNPPSQNPSSGNPIDIPYFLSLSLVPAFLLSLRILANPTRKGVITFEVGRFSEFSSSLVFVIDLIRKRKIPEELATTSYDEVKKKVRGYKEQVISFYFSFVGSSLILFFLFVFLQIEKTKGTYDLISAFSPMMNPVATVLLFVAEILAIFFVTLFGEMYLEWAEPIDQI